jgi:D-sedoheptulose 7-phosphate isomerase
MNRTSAWLSRYFDQLSQVLNAAQATRGDGSSMSCPEAIDWAVHQLANTKENDGKVMFVGNGGSAAIASHMAIDYSKNGQFSALAFNDGASLTCLANDLGYDQVFAHPISMLGKPVDLLVAISSSGQSQSILNAVQAARSKAMTVLTLSGFEDNNPLRSIGNVNLYIPDSSYGFVEISHLALCHAILDNAMGLAMEKAE